MRIYPLSSAIPNTQLTDLGDPAALGGEVLDGQPRISSRVDFQEGGMTAGIFEATTGTVRIHFPFTEHATILEGEVRITDEAGFAHTYRPGDSYLIRQGEVVLWEVSGPRVRKSFFNLTQS
jgi:uncharacterized cupin superfamily protein